MLSTSRCLDLADSSYAIEESAKPDFDSYLRRLLGCEDSTAKLNPSLLFAVTAKC